MNQMRVKMWTTAAVVAAILLVSLPEGVIAQPQAQELGLVLRGTRVEGTAGAPQRSYYERVIDPVDGQDGDDLVRYALTHNGELDAAREMIIQARGRMRQAGLRANPMLEVGGARALTSADKNFTIGAELPLELGGRKGARVAVAQREIQLRQAEVKDFERKLAAEVKLKYADAIANARNLKAAEDLFMLTRDSHRIVQARVERGKSAPLEQNLLMVELNRADATMINMESKTEVAILELKKTIGMPPEEPLRLKGEFKSGSQPSPAGEALATALEKRPDLVAARAEEQLAAAQVEQARTEGKFDASIFGGYMRQRMGFPVNGVDSAGQLAPVDGVFHFATFGLRLSLPVRNANQGNIEVALAAVEAARRRREFAENVVRNEVAAAYARFARAQAAIAIFRDGVREQALRNIEIIRQTYVLGQKTVLDYLSEQRRFVEIETAYTDVLKEYFDSTVEIEKTAGSALPSA